jgi:Fic family protein
MHRRVSEGVLDVADAAGRLRTLIEKVEISNEFTNQVFHVPPPASELPHRLEVMCRFANGDLPDFIHPVIRAIILHFWLAYDHPFVDGNGRTARALFYWQMLHQGYWIFEFISISQILRKAPVQYGTAFLHTETDENDLTYFVIHQAEVIRRALRELREYAAEKSRVTRLSVAQFQQLFDLNHRQQAILDHALHQKGAVYTVAGHQTRQAIAYATARADLLDLAQKGLLTQTKAGKTFRFVAPLDLEQRLGARRGE